MVNKDSASGIDYLKDVAGEVLGFLGTGAIVASSVFEVMRTDKIGWQAKLAVIGTILTMVAACNGAPGLPPTIDVNVATNTPVPTLAISTQEPTGVVPTTVKEPTRKPAESTSTPPIATPGVLERLTGALFGAGGEGGGTKDCTLPGTIAGTDMKYVYVGENNVPCVAITDAEGNPMHYQVAIPGSLVVAGETFSLNSELSKAGARVYIDQNGNRVTLIDYWPAQNGEVYLGLNSSGEYVAVGRDGTGLDTHITEINEIVQVFNGFTEITAPDGKTRRVVWNEELAKQDQVVWTYEVDRASVDGLVPSVDPRVKWKVEPSYLDRTNLVFAEDIGAVVIGFRLILESGGNQDYYQTEALVWSQGKVYRVRNMVVSGLASQSNLTPEFSLPVGLNSLAAMQAKFNGFGVQTGTTVQFVGRVVGAPIESCGILTGEKKEVKQTESRRLCEIDNPNAPKSSSDLKALLQIRVGIDPLGKTFQELWEAPLLDPGIPGQIGF